MDEESDWDSEPELPPPKPQPAAAKKPNGALQHHQGDSRGEEPSHDHQRDGRRSKGPRRAAGGGESGSAPAGDSGAAPPPSPRGSSHSQPRPKQRQLESRQSEQRRSDSRQRRTEQDRTEEQPPFNFRPETDDGQRGTSRQKPRPPGRQQRSEYTVPAGQTAGPAPAPAAPDSDPEPAHTPVLLWYPGPTHVPILRESGSSPAVALSPSPRPRSGRCLPPPLAEGSTVPPAAASQDDLPLKLVGPPGVVGYGSPSPDDPTSLVSEPPTNGGPLVPLDGPRAASERSSPPVDDAETETAALAVVVSSCQFSQPDLRMLRPGDRNPSQLLSRYGRLSHRQLVKMWSELLWVASVPILLITTFLFALMRCLLEAVVRPVTLGPLQLFGDHLLKPAAVTLHDALLLPAATLLANGLSALALVGRPLGDTLDALVRPLATLLASCRPVQLRSHLLAGLQTHLPIDVAALARIIR